MLIYFVLFIYFSLVNMISLFYCMNINELDTVFVQTDIEGKMFEFSHKFLIVISWFCCGCGRYNNRAGGRKV